MQDGASIVGVEILTAKNLTIVVTSRIILEMMEMVYKS
jgi:hypothetical protein